MTNILQNLKYNIILKFLQYFSNFHDEMNYLRQNGKFRFEKDSFSKNPQATIFKKQKALLSMKSLQTKPQIKKISIILIFNIL